MSIELDISIQKESGTVVVRSPAVATSASWSQLKALLERFIAVADITSVEVDRYRSLAVLGLSRHGKGAAQGSTATIVRRIAQELRQKTTVSTICDAYSGLPSMRLSKLSTNVVGGSVCSEAAGRTRLQHPLLRGVPDRDAIVGPLLAAMNGVERVTISPMTGTVLVLHAPTVSASQILVALEQILFRSGSVNGDGAGTTRMVLSGGCVGMAILADTIAPWLIPVTAGTLVACNLPTLFRGVRELVTFKWRLPALYTVIMGTTLASGQVLAASLMQASIVGWYWWSNRRLRSMIAELLSSESLSHLSERVNSVSASPSSVGLDGTVSTESFAPVNRIASNGTADRGTVQPLTDAVTTPVGAGSAYESAITSLARTAMGTQPTAKGHDGAAQFVPFAFATGAAALLTNDITALAAVLRPDYATGPSISERLSMVAGVRQLLVHGWMVVSPDALGRLAAVDTVLVLGDHRQPGSDLAVESAALPVSAVPILAAARQSWKLHNSHRSVEVIRISGDPLACVSYIRQLAGSGTKVAVCGPTQILAQLKPEDAVRIACNVDEFGRSCDFDIVALPGRQDLLDVWDVLDHQNRCTGRVWPVVLTCNIASVLGAFLVGLTSLHVVILTNLGTWTAYTLFANQVDRIQKRPTSSTVGSNGKTNSNSEGKFAIQRRQPDDRSIRMTPTPQRAAGPIDRPSRTRNFS